MNKNFVSIVVVAIALMLACKRAPEQLVSDEKQDLISNNLHPIEIKTTMVYIPGGEYKPFYSSDSDLVAVQPFLLDERPVTNQEYLKFVEANPQWRKSNIKRIYSDAVYLRDWQGDLELPKGALLDAPVTFVPWFAAKAYAQSIGKRLPTLDEWEFVAMADTEVPNAREKKKYSDDIIDLYMQKDRQYKSVKLSPPNYWGVYNMFDLIWEWTDDFNSILTTGDSRAGEYDDKNMFCAAGGATSATDILNYAAFMRFALRASIKANYNIANLGFRCAKDTTVVLPQ
ncbi:MAG: formylglycine-generating enzyme family protein [Chitinophagales bacterium]|nr:formylglycine-generating enzyme family protein [Chitinophagales bacterium]